MLFKLCAEDTYAHYNELIVLLSLTVFNNY